ncbi:MAG: DUF72 domain-containing protein [Thermoflavifilum sp.]|nr:DUF72 domain-containing protein [Thermoflavifilum sp.]
MARVYIGTSGFAYASWKGKFYPNHLPREQFFAYYVRHFSAVEINASFYHTPRHTTIQQWVAQAPPGFVFSFKLSRYITHIQRLLVDTSSLTRFFTALQPCTQLTHPTLILIQLPASLKPHISLLSDFVQKLPTNFDYAWEFRHPEWFQPEVYELLRAHRMAIVLADSPLLAGGRRKWPWVDVSTAPFVYIRFHGSQKLFTSSYTEEELKSYATLIEQKMAQGLEVFAFFNNDAAGYAIDNAFVLKRLISETN